MAGSDIGILATTVGFKSLTPNKKLAEPSSMRTLPVIDNSVPVGKNVHTSVDCYVAGQYVQRNGKSIEVMQRYSVYVSYGRSTQSQTMKELRDRIANDFQARYGGTFNITTIFVPDLQTPQSPTDEPIFMYGGTRYAGSPMSPFYKVERARFEIGSERLKAEKNISSIRKRYNYR